ncbi:uncharacterized protein VP01_6638g1 [Puccinia sorghi]|uniref:Reverse transcriptase Ty1/copia-type domain-containing protein n=1 Tax=Puccinia sorghi TaxID=27349 RepID=A0A0L6UFX5_9BASI|nr:uncharacterized protein VP01_6638g1 [Puccinia sorghi]
MIRIQKRFSLLTLKKSLYGLTQALKNWYKTLTSWLASISFQESSCNPCLYFFSEKKSIIFFHIDDLVLVGNGQKFKEKFEKQFSNLACHPPNTLLGMK